MQEHETLSKEELAYLMKIEWEALQTPSWSKDDLIEFGKAIFGKTALKDLDPKKFNQLFPFLKAIAEHLGIKLKEAVLPTPSVVTASPPSLITTGSGDCPKGPVGPVGPSSSVGPDTPETSTAVATDSEPTKEQP